MIVDGRKIAQDILSSIKRDVSSEGDSPKLVVITCAPNFETQKFLKIKMRKAKEVGINVIVVELPEQITNEAACTTISKAAESSDGIVVQLPFPDHIDRDALIAAIPKTHDVDAFNIEDNEILPPVVGAIHEVLKSEDVDLKGKHVTVVGGGKLVGQPAVAWLEGEGAEVSVVTKEDTDSGSKTKDADVLVLGAGVPGLIKPDMVKEGVIILDAGTSEDAGELKGDAAAACAEKASIFTPVPGGIGPITVAMLLKNLVLLHRKKG